MRKGDIVRVKKSGTEGMIVYRKGNDTIGINTSHYRLVKDKEVVYKMGCDIVVTKEEIEKV